MNLKRLLEQAEAQAFDVDPWPQCAPAKDGVVLMPFKFMTPTGNEGEYRAEFAICHAVRVTEAAVRYGDSPPVFLPLANAVSTYPTDRLTLQYQQGS